MEYIKLYLHTSFSQETTLARHKNSLLRGAFGWALKKAVCVNIEKECTSCLLQKTCLFPTVFSPLPNQEKPTIKGLPPDPPPAYVLMPCEKGESKTFFTKDDELIFSLTLFGSACQYVPYFVHAITLMGQNGLGSKNQEGKRASFILEKVFCDNQDIYDKEKNILTSIPNSTSLKIPTWEKKENLDTTFFTVYCNSPLRFKSESFLSKDLTFEMLMRLLLRRLLALSVYYGEGKSELDTHSLFEATKQVSIEDNKLNWIDVERYSNRQKSRMKLGGVQGHIIFKGDYTLWKEWLELAQILHLGKQTAFGYGNITFSKHEI